jgi:diguanylate cyclase (GGDEF)-like protein
VVGEGGIPVGLVSRHQLMNMLASRYGRDLYGREPVVKFMEEQPLIIEKNQPLEEVSQIITGSGEFSGLHDFIITEKGCYVGIGTVHALLREITDLQIQHARHANPLTLLPGNVPINEHLEQLLQAGEPFAACYCDLDHFKPFNDHYGYRRGDQVICLLGRLLQEEADRRADFIGHIGGDDFMAVFRSENWLERCRRLIRRFDEEIAAFYDVEDRRKGGLTCENRDGSRRFFPFVSLSVGAVHSCCGPFDSCHAISTAAAEVKHQAKKIPGSSLFIDRRFRLIDDTAALPLNLHP